MSVTDLQNLGPNSTKRFAFRADWEALDGNVWTPWGTLLVAEETNAAGKPDPDYPSAKAGLVYELIPSASDPSVLDRIIARRNGYSPRGMPLTSRGYYSISESNSG